MRLGLLLLFAIAGRAWAQDPVDIGVIKESDIVVVQKLLYPKAGRTEFGLYVSFDDGTRWQLLQLNLPVTPVTDLKVQSDDLVASTQGRSFWILDDLSPLRQINDEVSAAKLHLYVPRDVYRFGAAAGARPGDPYAKNPPSGAIIDYYVAEAPQSPVTLEILGGVGEVIRHYSSEKKESEDMKEKEKPKMNHSNNHKPAKHKGTLTDKMRENPWVAAVFVLGILVIILLITNFTGMTGNATAIPADDAGDKTLRFQTLLLNPSHER